MTIKTAKHIHFTGIKGVGMTAVALCAQDLGAAVTGSDVAGEFVTAEALKARALNATPDFDPAGVDPATDLLVYTGAHQGAKNPQVIGAASRGVPCISLAQATGQLMEGKIGLSVCGVGGKTTTSAMLATILHSAGRHPSYVVGVGNVASLPFPGKYDLQGQHFVAEADEYATSPGSDTTPRFLHQHPQAIMCTNIRHDHPDMYPDLTATKAAYLAFFKALPPDGVLIYHSDCPHTPALIADLKVNKISVGHAVGSTYQLVDVLSQSGQSRVSFVENGQVQQLVLKVPGDFNAKNALMAYATARHYGLTHQEIQDALLTFTGTSRRFEYKGTYHDALFYDDYAHHPSEIVSTITAAREWFPGKKIMVVFESHTYSRTKVLLPEFAVSFTGADRVVITDIFASARESEDLSISGQILAEAVLVHNPRTVFVPKVDLVQYINQNIDNDTVLFTMGAGDVYTIHHHFFRK